MASSTIENYVKRIFIEQQRNGEVIVPMGRLAEIMDVSPGTATTMAKMLDKSGLATYLPRRGSSLTDVGRDLAVHVLRCHRLVELFLVQHLGLDWSEIHEEAERLEHAISNRVLDKLDAFLGHPEVDPHGDPIPTAEGHIRDSYLQCLSTCVDGQRVRIGRVIDQNPQFLLLMDRYGLKPNTEVVIDTRDAVADAITLHPADGGQSLTLGLRVASKIQVET